MASDGSLVRQPSTTGAQSRSNRTYYRVQRISAAREDLTCDIYFDAVSKVQMSERVFD